MTPRDYIEDFDSPDDNGYYSHTCPECNEVFMGHKRRVGLCKACHLKALEAVMYSINTGTHPIIQQRDALLTAAEAVLKGEGFVTEQYNQLKAAIEQCTK